jgi:hypothetical protein
MSDDHAYTRLDIEAIVIGYAMSRLDLKYLASRHLQAWGQVYMEAGDILSCPPMSLKNLRDEFDPVHSNPRRGWHRHTDKLRPSRQRVLDELEVLSDDALLELISRILSRDEEAVATAIDSLAVRTRIAHNVAERLLTGRRAEEYFLEHSQELVGFTTSQIIDLRQSALGFDFGIDSRPELAIEVKGIKQHRGDVQFTDREWSEAGYRGERYWLAVVGNLGAEPSARIIRDPHASLAAHCSYKTTIAAVWRSTVSV